MTMLGAASGLSGVQVSYIYPGRTVQRECVYGGKVGGPQDQATMRGGSARVGREERALFLLHIEVATPGGPAEAAANEVRACVLGRIVEELIAADGTLGGVAGLVNTY